MAYDKTNKGILSKNDRREKDTHPEYTGTINVDGKDYWLSAWVKERNDGSGKFFSLSVKPKEQKEQAKPAKAPTVADLESDLPF